MIIFMTTIYAVIRRLLGIEVCVIVHDLNIYMASYRRRIGRYGRNVYTIVLIKCEVSYL